MHIAILIERNGIRAQVETDGLGTTSIPGVCKIRWYAPAYRNRGRDYYSLTHQLTGRALNKVPLTSDECDRLIESLADCPIEWDRIVDGRTAVEYYANRLTDEAKSIAGMYR